MLQLAKAILDCKGRVISTPDLDTKIQAVLAALLQHHPVLVPYPLHWFSKSKPHFQGFFGDTSGTAPVIWSCCGTIVPNFPHLLIIKLGVMQHQKCVLVVWWFDWWLIAAVLTNHFWFLKNWSWNATLWPWPTNICVVYRWIHSFGTFKAHLYQITP